MKKMSGFLFVLLLGAVVAQAQRHDPVNPQKDRMEFMGYTIKLLSAPGGTYGYDIFKDRQLVLHQRGNPFTGFTQGLLSKDDVYKVAKWQIQNSQGRAEPRSVAQRPLKGWQKLSPAQQQRLASGHRAARPQMSQRLPLAVAKQLNIRLHP